VGVAGAVLLQVLEVVLACNMRHATLNALTNNHIVNLNHI
jgi:hypothetical protein